MISTKLPIHISNYSYDSRISIDGSLSCCSSTDTGSELKPYQGMFLVMVMDLMFMVMVKFMAPTIFDFLP